MHTHTPKPSPEQPQEQAAAAPSKKRSLGRWLRWPLKIALGLLSLCCTALLLAALALWAWGGQEGSLANTLAALEKIGLIGRAQGVTGSLAQGGRIAQLEAQFGSTSISAQNLQLQWQAKALLQGQLHIQKIAAQQLHIRILPSDQPSPPSTAPRSLALPVAVQVDSLELGELAIFLDPKSTQPSWQASGVAAHYQYLQTQGKLAEQHRLAITALQSYGGQYQAQAQLGAQSPFALQATASATLALPDMPDTPPLLAQLQAGGSLLDIRAQLDAHTAGHAQEQLTQAKLVIASEAKQSTASMSSTTDGLPRRYAPRNDGVVQGLAQASPSHIAQLQARIQPWGKLLLQDLQGELSNFDLRAFAPQLPHTQISGQLLPQLAGFSTGNDAGDTLNIDLHNTAAAPWDAGGLPISRVQGQLIWQREQLRLPKLSLHSGAGQLQLQGQWQAGTGAWQITGQAADLDLAAIHSAFAASRLQGEISASQTAPAQTPEQTAAKQTAPIVFALDVSNSAAAGKYGDKLDIRSAQAQGSWQNGALNLPKLQLHTSDAQLQGSASYASAAQQAQLDLQLAAPGIKGQAQGQISPKNGQGQLQLQLQNAGDFSAWLSRWPGMDAPPLVGSAQAQANWQGGWQNLQLQAAISSPELRVLSNSKSSTKITAKNDKNSAKAAWEAPENAADLRLSQVQLQARGALSALQLSLQGDWAQGGQHGRAQVQAQAKVKTEPSLAIALQTSQAEFSMAEQASPLAAGWQLAQASPIALQWQAGRSQLAAGSLRLTAPQALRVGAQRSLLLQWQDSELTQAPSGGIARARSSGQIVGLSHTWLEALSGASLADMGLAGQILLDAHWDVRLDEHLAIKASVQRQSGDFYLQEPGRHWAQASRSAGNNDSPAQQSAGLRDVYLRITGTDQGLRLQALWNSARAGRVQADIASSLQRQGGAWTWPETSPIKGSVQADLPTLGLWSALAPTGWRVGGKMALDAAISGSRLAPDLRGQLQVQDLSMRSVLDGIELKNGQLQARFAGTRMALERFHIEGAEGELNATGQLAWEAGQPSMQIDMQAQRLRASNRPDRRVTISGGVQAGLQGKNITLQGKLGIDEALILLADSSKPSLGDDVRIVRKKQTEQNATTVPSEAQLAAEEAAAQAAAQAALAPFAAAAPKEAAWALKAAVQLDMGQDMRVRGMGLDTRLGGVLTIQTVSEQSTSKGQLALRPEIVGSLHTIGGEYRAYGQWLDIEEGIIRFTGPYSNPQLDILAIRPRTEERVGVRITGPASNPRVALYAENAMPDSEKLAWLILGREGSNGGAEAAMLQQAAVALLGSGSSGGLAQSIGLDELGYRSAETNSDGTVRESSISIGKRLSRRLYLSYERSLSGALGTLFVFYDISRRFTLRAQTNEEASALDVIFTRRYQSLLPAKRAALNAAAERERQAEIDADAARKQSKTGEQKSVPNQP